MPAPLLRHSILVSLGRAARRRTAWPLRTSSTVLAAATLGIAMVGPSTVRAQVATEVKVERVKPEKEKHPTLQFLKDNIDFIRAQFDRVRERRLPGRGDAEPIDPRFLAYQRMLSEVAAAQDSVAAVEEKRKRQELLESVRQLGDLEAQLDLMERLLAEQRTRLGMLQEDFAGHQKTALMVVLSGYPGQVAVSEVAIALEGGATVSVPLSADQRETLSHGGMVQVFHGFVEAREQVVQVKIAGDRWPSGDSGFVTLDPSRDRITILRLDLSAVQAVGGAASIRASTWLHDAHVPPRAG